MRYLIAVAAVLLCAFCPAYAQKTTLPRTQVVFSCQCDDAVGQLYATDLRDLLATSPRYVQTDNAVVTDSAGKVLHYRWHLQVLSMDPSESNSGQDSVISVAILLGNTIFMTQDVQWCPIGQAEGCARSTLAGFDSYVNSLK